MDLLATKELGEDSPPLTNINKTEPGAATVLTALCMSSPKGDERPGKHTQISAHAPDFDTNQLLSVHYLPRGFTVTQ